uniref:Lipocalin/cytosolic fatty-acid binding domain-containing protein n=1 Tax=Graphocephala atropunctata TaxID=36148 RepID=A0A1B6KWJ1_9HEMI
MRNYLFGAVQIFLVLGAQGFSFSWPHWGRCPNLEVQQGFTVTSYMGIWYTQAGYNIDSVQGKGRCSQAMYAYDYDRQVVNVTNKQIMASTNRWVSIDGTAVEVDPSRHEGKLDVTFRVPIVGDVTGPYWILGTDYNTYTVVYGCRNFLFFFHYYSTWLLSREQDIDGTGEAPQFYALVDAVLAKNKIDPSTFNQVDQVNCNV